MPLDINRCLTFQLSILFLKPKIPVPVEIESPFQRIILSAEILKSSVTYIPLIDAENMQFVKSASKTCLQKALITLPPDAVVLYEPFANCLTGIVTEPPPIGIIGNKLLFGVNEPVPKIKELS